jgi:exoribonuclease R
VASNCNGKKYSAKRAGEQSGELYLSLYVGMHGPLREEAVVIDVKDHSFDVLVLRTGSNHRVYTNVSAKHSLLIYTQAINHHILEPTSKYSKVSILPAPVLQTTRFYELDCISPECPA